MSDKFYVIHSDMSRELFRPRLIAETIINETGVDEELAKKIQNRITQKIYIFAPHAVFVLEYLLSPGLTGFLRCGFLAAWQLAVFLAYFGI